MKTANSREVAFIQKSHQIINSKRIYTDYIHRLAWGTDASCYRHIPEVVLFPKNEDEMQKLLQTVYQDNVAVTFRAAGTSLSGQTLSDSVMIVAGKLWESYKMNDKAETITMQPGLVGARVNEILQPYGKKFTPDPASLQSAMVGGIVMNNASGMNCGTHANSDKMLVSARILFADGYLLDTGDKQSQNRFRNERTSFLKELEEIRQTVINNQPLKERILHKYSIKNVTGLNLLPLVVFDDPFDIIAHLLVGSEGTLAFMSEVTMKTAAILPFSASAMVYFKNIRTACLAVQEIKHTSAVGAELLDRKALRSVEGKPGMPEHLPLFGEEVTALLIETKANTHKELEDNIQEISQVLGDFDTEMPFEFTDDASVYKTWWEMRSGIFPSVGGMRPAGTTTIIEDVAFHLEDLPEATAELQHILVKHGYADGVIYGHSLEGNFHFIINQQFDDPAEVERYEHLMNDVVELVTNKFDGSLKAEHGTGRNMAPFVEREWGSDAFEVMKRIKKLFDPKNILNPGVIFNDDPTVHLKNFKSFTPTNPHVDKCIECGFCEINCLTSGFTLSARQRIVIQREISRLRKSVENEKLRQQLEREYLYPGNVTCAGDGLCATSCPMGINTGELTHDLRHKQFPSDSIGWQIGNFTANHFAGVKSGLRSVLFLANTAHNVLGSKAMTFVANEAYKLGTPLWTTAMPKPYKMKREEAVITQNPLKVVYFPSCINQTMGVAKGNPDQTPLPDKMDGLLKKAGYEVIYPEKMESLCCGTIWESKGMFDIADRKTFDLEEALLKASENGRYPVLCDQSPCLYRMREKIKRLKLYEPVEFIETFLVNRLDFHPINEPVAIHTTCSMTKMHLGNMLFQLAHRCSSEVLVPQEVGCCGFAGDKGFTHPEVNRYALRKLAPQLESSDIKYGYSNSRTCEIGLTTNGKIPYMSIVYLVDQCTTPKTQ
ncbi:FAD-binding and (Fe-S)-binding domain-containing protein [Microbacter margulisiae]|uniref:D-lactate dehydrogenase (cytochrome) n=1 Tax=Microbacter margulisiae TaxID=1350067 RepID=A0A7W5H2I6_9PORP|nr:FAD-binding and (Fe-S)-binding domain-containing protein [Microbacter margulisiae]MBB3187461.1 D-lactate dehydrogenase [Microbacter margulisiae]